MTLALTLLSAAACNLSDPIESDETQATSDTTSDVPDPIDADTEVPDAADTSASDGDRDDVRPPIDSDSPDSRASDTDLADLDVDSRDTEVSDARDTDVVVNCDTGGETCGNNLDDDCDGVVDEGCSCSYLGKLQGVCTSSVIDETGDCKKPAAYQSKELSCDQLDNDCDGSIDEDCSCTAGTMETCYSGPSGTKGIGVCSEGSRTCESDGTWGPCSDTVPSEEACDDVDDDCDGSTDEGCDADGDDYCDASRSTTGTPAVCPSGGGDCDDSSAAIHPGATEICDDGIDNNCNGDTDCAESTCDGKACGIGTGAACSNGSCVENACGDATDNDGDGATDCADSDCAGVQCNGTGTVCNQSSCTETACNDGIDNDGDDATDDCDPDCGGPVTCPAGTTCSSGACIETSCSDGQDNDGDGATDCLDSDCSCPGGEVCCHPGQSQPRCRSAC